MWLYLSYIGKSVAISLYLMQMAEEEEEEKLGGIPLMGTDIDYGCTEYMAIK